MIEIQFMPRFEEVLNSLLRMSNIDVVTDDGRVQRNGGISVQMKTFIDRTYPIWQHLGKFDRRIHFKHIKTIENNWLTVIKV